MTNAVVVLNNSIREKWIDAPKDSSVAGFKLKRFITVEPRVSTKRGEHGYYSKHSGSPAPEQK